MALSLVVWKQYKSEGSNERSSLNYVCSFSRLTGWVLLKLFNSFFWNIQIHRGQIEMVKAATEVRVGWERI